MPKVCYPCILKFSADFCGPCKAIEPYFKELAKQYAFDGISLNVEEEAVEDLLDDLGIKVKYLPTFALVNEKKKVVAKVEGADRQELKELFEKSKKL